MSTEPVRMPYRVHDREYRWFVIGSSLPADPDPINQLPRSQFDNLKLGTLITHGIKEDRFHYRVYETESAARADAVAAALRNK